MDVTDLSQVDHALASLPKAWESGCFGHNAGLAGLAPAYEAEVADGDHDSDQYCRLDLSDKENLAPDGGTK